MMRCDIPKTVSFSGHRVLSPAVQRSLFEGSIRNDDLTLRLRGKITREVGKLLEEGCDTFLCGMAEGFDLLAGDVVAAMRRDHPQLRLVPVIPWPGQARFFSPESRALYDRLIASAAESVIVSPAYSAHCFHLRNDYLVDNSGILICYYNGTKGGTAYTVKRAIREGLQIINLA